MYFLNRNCTEGTSRPTGMHKFVNIFNTLQKQQEQTNDAFIFPRETDQSDSQQ